MIKRLNVSRRQWNLIIGVLILPVLLEILCVSVVPTSREIQSLLLENERIADAEVFLDASIFNPQSFVFSSRQNSSKIRSALIELIEEKNVESTDIANENPLNFVRERFLESERIFIDRFQLGFGLNSENSSWPVEAFFSSVNFHATAVTLNLATNVFLRTLTNSSRRKISARNQPILTSTKSSSYVAQILSFLSCFEVFPVSLFPFLNGILASIFVSLFVFYSIDERRKKSKNLQLLTNLSRFSFFLSNFIFDLLLSTLLVAILTLIVGVAARTNPKSDADFKVFQRAEPLTFFFVSFFLYVLASIPFAFSFSLRPRTSIIGLTNFFILNVVGNIFDAVISSFTVFSQNPTPNDGPSKSYRVVEVLRWILAICLPSVNLKHSVFNIQLHESVPCIRNFNTFIGTNFPLDAGLTSLERTAIGAEILIFLVQFVFWTGFFLVIEYRTVFRRHCRKSSRVAQNSTFWNDEVRRREKGNFCFFH